MRGLWPLIIRSLRTRTLRAILTTIAVSLGVAGTLGAQIVVNGLDQQAASTSASRAGLSQLDIYATSGDGFSSDQVNQISQFPGVSQTAPLLQKRVTARHAQSDIYGVTVTLVAADNNKVALRPVQLQSGRLPSADNAAEIAVDVGLLSSLGLNQPNLGKDTIYLNTLTGPDQFTIVGLTSSSAASPSFLRNVILISPKAATTTFGLGLHTPFVALTLQPGTSKAALVSKINQQFNGQVTATDPTSTNSPLGEIRILLIVLVGLEILVAAGVVASSTSLSTYERRREIGLLRIAGASRRQIFRLFAVEGALIIFVGAILGIFWGIGLGQLALHLYGNLSVNLNNLPWAATLAAGVGIFAATVGTSIPAIAATNLPILQAIRPLSPIEGQRRLRWPIRMALWATVAGAMLLLINDPIANILGVSLLLLGATSLLPWIVPVISRVLAKVLSLFTPDASLAATNLSRHRNRTALTLAGFVSSIATTMAIGILVAGTLTVSDYWIGKLFIGNVLVSSPATQPPALLPVFTQESGATDAVGLRFFSEPANGQATEIAATDLQAYSRYDNLDITNANRSTAISLVQSSNSLLVPSLLANSRHWIVGSIVAINTQNGLVPFTVAGIVDHSFPAADGTESLIMDSKIAINNFGQLAQGFDDLEVVSGQASLAKIQQTASQYGMQATSLSDIQASARRALLADFGLLLALGTIAVVIAALAIINTMLLNIRYGVRELALLRAVGMSQRRALQLVLVEAFLLVAIGLVVGLLLGLLLALPLLHASIAPGLVPPFTIPGTIVMFLAIGILLITLALASIPARKAVSINVVGAIRYE